MPTNKLIAWFLAGILLSTLASCTERIEVSLDDTYTRLVVEGSITTDTLAHQVRLTKTMDYFNNQPAEPITGASVHINDWVLTESPTQPGTYLTPPNVYGTIGETYTLRIDGVDVDSNGETETYWAESTIPSIAAADSIDVVYSEFSSFFKAWEILLYAQDPPERNNYVFKVWRNDTLLTDTINEWQVQDDELFNGNYVPGVTAQFLDASRPDEQIRTGDRITLEINSISSEYLSFYFEVLAESQGQNPLFSGPPANVRTNIQVENGNEPVGFFTAYSSYYISRTIVNPYKKKNKPQAR